MRRGSGEISHRVVDVDGVAHKRCSPCDALRPLSMFRRANSKPSGFQAWCKGCQSGRPKAEVKWGRPQLHVGLKRCARCEFILNVDSFGPSKRSADGSHSWCRACARRYSGADRTVTNAWKCQDRRKKAEARGVPLKIPSHDAHIRLWRKKADRAAKRKHDAHVAAYRRRPAARTAQKKLWLLAHPGVTRAKKAKRRAGKLQATPAWANPKAIRALYSAAVFTEKLVGEPWHVDHIVPLNNPIVCGLHCEANLQLLPGKENIEKSNKYWPDMPE